jgi:hypothetical protein
MGRRRLGLCAITSIMAIILFAAALAHAQEFPAFSFIPASFSDHSMSFNSFLRGDWVRNLGIGRAAVGVFLWRWLIESHQYRWARAKLCGRHTGYS